MTPDERTELEQKILRFRNALAECHIQPSRQHVLRDTMNDLQYQLEQIVQQERKGLNL